MQGRTLVFCRFFVGLFTIINAAMVLINTVVYFVMLADKATDPKIGNLLADVTTVDRGFAGRSPRELQDCWGYKISSAPLLSAFRPDGVFNRFLVRGRRFYGLVLCRVKIWQLFTCKSLPAQLIQDKDFQMNTI